MDYFDQFVRHASHAKWKSVAVPRHTKSGRLRKTIVQKPYFFRALRVHTCCIMDEISGWSQVPTGRCQNFVHLVTGHPWTN